VKALFIVHEDPLDLHAGVQVYTRSIAEIFSALGFETAIFSQKELDSDDILVEFEQKGVKYFLVNSRLLRVRKKRFKFFESFDNPEVAEIFRGVFNRFKPDILHVMHLLTLSGEIIFYAKRAGAKVVLTLWDYWYLCHRINLLKPDLSICSGPGAGVKCRHCGDQKYEKFPWNLAMPVMAAAFSKRTKYLRRLLNCVDLIHAPSHATKKIYVDNGVPDEKIELLPPGYVQMDCPEKKKIPGYIRLGFIGTVLPHRGLHVLLDALWGVDPARFELVVYGDTPDQKYYEDLRKKAEGLSVKFMGTFERNELAKIYQSFDILVFPTLWPEPYGLVVLEALSCKTPVLASRIGALPELIEHGYNGWLLEPKNVDEWRIFFNKLVQNYGIYDVLRPKPLVKFSFEEHVAKLAEIYKRLSGN